MCKQCKTKCLLYAVFLCVQFFPRSSQGSHHHHHNHHHLLLLLPLPLDSPTSSSSPPLLLLLPLLLLPFFFFLSSPLALLLFFFLLLPPPISNFLSHAQYCDLLRTRKHVHTSDPTHVYRWKRNVRVFRWACCVRFRVYCLRLQRHSKSWRTSVTKHSWRGERFSLAADIVCSTHV